MASLRSAGAGYGQYEVYWGRIWADLVHLKLDMSRSSKSEARYGQSEVYDGRIMASLRSRMAGYGRI